MFTKLNQCMVDLASKQESFRKKMSKFLGDERGAGAVEYALVIAVVVIMIIAATSVMDTPVREFFEGVIDKVKGEAGV